MSDISLKHIVEGALIAAGRPLSEDDLMLLFGENERPSRDDVREAISDLQQNLSGRGIELVKVASGYRIQVKAQLHPWVGKLWEEKPGKYSRAFLETLAIVAYRQPITRAEIEEIRGVSVSSHIMRLMQDRGWVRLVGYRDVPGRPGMYGTTRQFLDYFNLERLDDLPSLMEIKDFAGINEELDLEENEPEDDANQALDLGIEDDEEGVADVIELPLGQQAENPHE